MPVFAAEVANNLGSGVLVYDKNGDIYTANLDGSNEVQLSKTGDSHHPKWSPDGKRILYIRNTSLQTVLDDEGKPAEIGQPTDFYIMNRDGTEPHLLRHLNGVVTQPSWSPDGLKIGFYYQSKEEWLHQGSPSFVSGFYIMPVSGEDKPRLVSTDARNVSWSSDSKKLVFTVQRPHNHTALHTSTIDGGDERQLLDEDIYIDSDSAKWSSDDKLIAYRATVSRKTGDDKMTFQGMIGIVEPNGHNATPLTYDLGWDCWHPWWDHKLLVYSCYTMPSCQPDNVKVKPDLCIARTYTLDVTDPYAKPQIISEQKGSAATNLHDISP